MIKKFFDIKLTTLSSFYCIKIDYNNNRIDKLLFELQAVETTNGDVFIYFLNEKITENLEKIIEKNDDFDEQNKKLT